MDVKKRYFQEQHSRYRKTHKNYQPVLFNRCLTLFLEWNLTVILPTTCRNKIQVFKALHGLHLARMGYKHC